MIFRQLGSQQGMILFTSLLILSFLIALGVGAVVSVQGEYRITDNLKRGTSALYIAEAGVEWAKQQLGNSNLNPPTLADSSRDFSDGHFSLALLSSAPTSPLASRVVYRSNGTVRAATQTVQVQVTKSYDLSDAALVLRGSGKATQFSSGSFMISGLDYDPVSRAPLTDAKQRPAISAGSAALLRQIQDALNPSQTALLSGSDGAGASLSLSDRLSADAILQLASAICAASGAQRFTVPSDGRLSIGDEVWGSGGNSEIRCIQGLAQSGDQALIAGSVTGAGILVIRDAPLIVSGSFHWDGLVIVVGNDVGFRATGEQSKEINGSLMIAEPGQALSGAEPLVDIQGTLQVRFSRAALASAARLIPAAALETLYSSVPFYITQDYWRLVTP
jgi:Tfp pilus assembly protein PilX